MKLKAQLVAALGLSLAVVALVVPAVGQTTGSGYLDASDRSPGALAIQSNGLLGYRDAHQRGGEVVVVQTSISGYIDAHERARDGQIVVPTRLTGYVDAFERGEPVRATSPVMEIVVGNSGFDLGAAAVGVSSVLMLALLIGATLLTARHFRGGQLPH